MTTMTKTIENSISILLAEDNKGCQILTKKILTSLGLEVTIVNNGQEAVEAAIQQNFDLILMDMQMPKLNGYQATTKLKEAGVETPVIALTAYSMMDDKEKCLEAGCVDYLPKPLSVADLNKILEKHFYSTEEPA